MPIIIKPDPMKFDFETSSPKNRFEKKGINIKLSPDMGIAILRGTTLMVWSQKTIPIAYIPSPLTIQIFLSADKIN
jgi:hypothetical protein